MLYSSHPVVVESRRVNGSITSVSYFIGSYPTPASGFVTDPSRSILSQLSGNVARVPPPTAGKKRKPVETAVESQNVDDIDCEDMMVDKNCDQVRRRIRSHLDSGAMKVGEFCNAIGVSNKSLNDFLRQSGAMKGSGSATYINAWEFFKKREIAGVRMPNKKQKSDASASAIQSINDAGNSSSVSIASVHLPGEDFDNVAVYDTCDEVRRKIEAHLKKPGVTQAGFCRDLQAQLHSSDGPSRIQSNMLTAFRSKKGARQGNTSSVFYAAYVFFEKVRIQEGLGKTKHRVEMECIWPGGFDRVHGGHRGIWCPANKRPVEDKYGRVSCR